MRTSKGIVKLRRSGTQLGFTVPKTVNNQLLQYVNQEFECYAVTEDGGCDVVFTRLDKQKPITVDYEIITDQEEEEDYSLESNLNEVV